MFRERGYLLPSFKLDIGLVNEVRAAMLDLSEGDMSSINQYQKLKINNANPFVRIATSEVLLDCIENILGHDIVLLRTHSLFKKPNGQFKVDWHQDSCYFPLYPIQGITVWMAFDDANTINGCMRYAEKTHLTDLPHVPQQRMAFRLTIPDEVSNKFESVVDVPREKGQVAIHHLRLAHSSYANASDQPRAAMAFVYIPGTTQYNHRLHKRKLIELGWNRDIVTARLGTLLLRGRSFHDNNVIWQYCKD